MAKVSDSQFVNISHDLLERVMDMTEGVSKIGIGIASIMLLVVVLYYVINILNGGKFQTQMLVPLLIFFCVCNFQWIAKPVLKFTTTITSSLTDTLKEQKQKLLTSDPMTKDVTTINDHFVSKHLENDPTNKNGHEVTEEEKVGAESEGTISTSKPSNFAEKIWKAIYYGSAVGIVRDLALSSNKSVQENLTSERLSFSGIICQLMSWLCSGFSFCLRVFGIMMTSIIVVLGPITFAFAVLPGKGGVIVSWFIRLCQFSLFGPLCTFIDTFTVSTYTLLDTTASDAMGFLMVFALILANIVGLLSVPTIASMIIEGASGAVSLSQGLQTIGSATMAVGGAGLAATAGSNNMFSNFMAGMQHKGIVGFVQEMRKDTYDDAGNVTGKAGFMGAVRNITEYGQGAVYGWNVQDKKD